MLRDVPDTGEPRTPATAVSFYLDVDVDWLMFNGMRLFQHKQATSSDGRFFSNMSFRGQRTNK